MSRILTITMNPAIDITTAAPEVVPGRKLRCDPPRIDPGGGGINVSRVIKELGGTSTALVAIAGPTGMTMRELVEAAGIDAVFLDAAGMTRQSFAVHDRTSGKQYRFVLPGPTQDAAFAESALDVITEMLTSGEYAYVVASGSLPPGLPEDFYGNVAAAVCARGARMILDTSGPALRAAIGRGVFLIRINDIEAAELGAMLGADRSSPKNLARSIVASGGADAVIMTIGAEGAILVFGQRTAHIRPPPVEVVSPVGAGDSFVAALCFALSEGWTMEESCAYGVAAASAAMTTEATELAHRDDIDRLYAEIENQIPMPDGALRHRRTAGER